MLFRSFFTSLLLLVALPAQSSEYESAEELKTSVESYLQETLMHELSITTENDIQVHASNLDPRLKLRKCQGEIEKRITSPKPYGSNLSVKLMCTGQQRWAIYVPSKVSIYTEIAVLSRNLSRGDILDEEDIALQRMDTTTVGDGYIMQPSRLIGMQLQRRLGAGQAIRLSHIKAAKIIKKGDKVVLEAGNSGLSVVTSGQALSGGGLGQEIQVRNTHSKRIVTAKIIAPGRVKVIM